MPVYEHKCNVCDETLAEFRKLGDWAKLPACPVCGIPMPRAYSIPSVRASYKKPLEMQSMGFLATSEDVAEHRQRFPNIDLRFREGSAIPVLRSLSQRRQYQKASGWVDLKDYA